jgi:hypothetical protein
MVENILQEVSLGMLAMDRPEIVDENVEYAQDDDQECCGPFGLETNSDHNASGQTNDGDENARNAPCALEDETKEKENNQYTTSKKETGQRASARRKWDQRVNVLFLAIRFAH